MVPIVQAAAIEAGSQAVGGLIGKHSSNKSADLQYRAAQQALEFEKQKEAERKAEYDKQQSELKAQWEAEQARREPYRRAAAAVLSQAGRRLGLGDLGAGASLSRPMPAGWDGTVASKVAKPSMNLGSLAGYSAAPDPTSTTPQLNLGNLADWSRVARGY